MIPCRSGALAPAPICRRVDVEILAVKIDTLFLDELIDVLGEPLAGLRIAEIQESATSSTEDPFGVILRKPGIGVNAFRLEPDDRFDALGVGVIADRPQPARESLRIYFPGAGLGPADVAERIPACIHPPVADLDTFIQIAIDTRFLVLLGGLLHLVEQMGAAPEKLRLWHSAVGLGHVVGEHPAPPDVLRESSFASRIAEPSAACGFSRRRVASDASTPARHGSAGRHPRRGSTTTTTVPASPRPQ